MERFWDLMGLLVIGLLIIIGFIIEFIYTTFMMIIKFPMRWKCAISGHDWSDNGGGGFLSFNIGWRFTCDRCGKRSRGDWKDFDNKPFTAKLKIK